MFDDRAKSGRNRKRNGWRGLLNRIVPGTRVVIHEGSRLARETLLFLEMMREVKARGGTIELVTGNTSDQMVLTILAVVAEYDYRYTNTRMRDGKVQKVADGVPITRAPYGYKKVGEDFVINEAEARWVRTIFSMRLNGESVPKIVAYLKKKKARMREGESWTLGRVVRMLRMPIYAGYLVYKRPVYEWEDS